MPLRFEKFSFGSIRIDGAAYENDLIIDRGEVRKTKKKASMRYRDAYAHTPLSVEEEIPWHCRRLVVGTGAEGQLPVMPEVQEDARRRNVELPVEVETSDLQPEGTAMDFIEPSPWKMRIVPSCALAYRGWWINDPQESL